MQRKRIAVLLGALAIVSIFAFRREPVISEPVRHEAAVVVEDAVPLPMRSVETELRMSRSRRDLFAYEAKPVVVAAPVIATVATPQPVIELPAPAPTPAPTAPPFPYRYIGRFGPRHDPIAAFVGNDRIVTVRPGERIDEQFVLRAIGVETVEVDAGGWAGKIPVGLSSPI